MQLDNSAKKYLRQNGVTPDTWVLPEGVGTYLSMVRPENRDFLLKGPEGPASYNSALNDAKSTSTKMMTANNCTIYESKTFEIPGAPGPVDPLNRQVSVGEYVTMCDTVFDTVGATDYKSYMRDIFVYNEQRDDFSRLSLKAALKACCRFDTEGFLYFPPDFGVGEHNIKDMFFMDSGRPAYVFGDIRHSHLTDETLKKLADSVIAYGMQTNAATTGPLKTTTRAGFVGGAQLNELMTFIENVFPESRVFKPEYQYVDAQTSFLRNILGVAAAGAAPGNDDFNDGDLDIAVRTLFKIATVPTKREEARKLLGRAISTVENEGDLVLPEEVAAVNKTIDKVVNRINHTAANEAAAARGISHVAAAIQAGKLLATTVGKPENLRRHYAYLVHRVLAGKARVAITDGLITTWKTALETLTDADIMNPDAPAAAGFAGGPLVAGVLSTAGGPFPAAGGAARGPDLATPMNIIGAFDIPRANREAAAFGADHTAVEESRFGTFGRRTRPYTHVTAYDGHTGFPEEDYKESKLMEKRWHEAGDYLADSDALKLAIIRAFLHTPINENVLHKLIDRDIYFPFEFIIFRPRITHNMATAILLKAGAETGETLVGHADFQLADDVVRKMHYGNFTLYSKSIVYKSDSVYLAENVYATGYVGGNDVTMNTLHSLATEDQRRSMYVALVPVCDSGSEDGPVSSAGGYFNPMDVTGKFATNVPHLANLDAEVGNGNNELHYPSAQFYSHVWQMNNSTQRLETEFVYAQVNSHNTLCFQGHQTTYNPVSKTFDMTTINTGHFGERVYPGCGKVRRGAMKYLEPVSYTMAFGARKSHTVVGV